MESNTRPQPSQLKTAVSLNEMCAAFFVGVAEKQAGDLRRVGLARGLRPFLDPGTSEWVKRPFYDGLVFHRVIPSFMIQGGDIRGNGSGEPGYTIPDEKNAPHKFDRGGVLAMANRGSNTGGSQFFITEQAQPPLDDGGAAGGALVSD